MVTLFEESKLLSWLCFVHVVISEEEGRRHRIAFNSLYLFSFKSINYEAMERHCMIHAWRDPSAASLKGASSLLMPISLFVSLDFIREAWPP